MHTLILYENMLLLLTIIALAQLQCVYQTV